MESLIERVPTHCRPDHRFARVGNILRLAAPHSRSDAIEGDRGRIPASDGGLSARPRGAARRRPERQMAACHREVGAIFRDRPPRDGRYHDKAVLRRWLGLWLRFEQAGSDDARRLLVGTGARHILARPLLIDDAVERLETSIGYFAARDRVFRTFHAGFAGSECPLQGTESLTACVLAGAVAARLNEAARTARSFPELGAAPFDTDTTRSAFDHALA